jgi:hypothetical protein
VSAAADWLALVEPQRLRQLAYDHAATRRRIRDGYLLRAAELLCGTPWSQARALGSALNRYQSSQRYRLARRLGREDGSELERLLFQALAWGPVPGSVRRLYTALPLCQASCRVDLSRFL